MMYQYESLNLNVDLAFRLVVLRLRRLHESHRP